MTPGRPKKDEIVKSEFQLTDKDKIIFGAINNASKIINIRNFTNEEKINLVKILLPKLFTDNE
jgi:hypothetical protein